MTDVSGLLVVDKPAGLTSHAVVGRARRVLGTRKVGHAGTLDPMATGVLVLGVGRATRLLGHLSGHDKEYSATIRLGSSTVTDDAEGDIVSVAPAERVAGVDEEMIRAQMAAMSGDVMQVPTAVSAIKVDGQRAYARVRSGEDVTLRARPVTVRRFDALRMTRNPEAIDIDVEVVCTSGTYVRALARDLGSALGVGGHLTALRRTRSGPWSLADAVDWSVLDSEDDVEVHQPTELLMGLSEAAQRSFATVTVDEESRLWIRNGRPLREVPALTGLVVTTAVLSVPGELVALVGPGERGPQYLAVFES